MRIALPFLQTSRGKAERVNGISMVTETRYDGMNDKDPFGFK